VTWSGTVRQGAWRVCRTYPECQLCFWLKCELGAPDSTLCLYLCVRVLVGMCLRRVRAPPVKRVCVAVYSTLCLSVFLFFCLSFCLSFCAHVQANGLGWYPEFNKVWEWFGMPGYSW
jgi:hypothetical protein